MTSISFLSICCVLASLPEHFPARTEVGGGETQWWQPPVTPGLSPAVVSRIEEGPVSAYTSYTLQPSINYAVCFIADKVPQIGSCQGPL